MRLLLLLSLTFLWLGLGVACHSGTSSAVRIESQLRPARSGASTTSAPIRIAVPEPLRDRIQIIVADDADRARIALVPAGQPADVAVRISPASGVDHVVQRWSVVTAASRLDLDAVSLADLRDAAAAGALFAAAEDGATVETLLPTGATLVPVPLAELPARLAATPGSLGIVPVDRVTARVRALALDGVDPVRNIGDLAQYPLVMRAGVDLVTSSAGARALQERLVARLAVAEPPVVRLLFTGDLIPSRCVYDQIRRAGDWSAPFRSTAPVLRQADITVGSLDSAISDRGMPIGCRETFSLLAPTRVVEGFVAAGFDVITVATNHVKDCGASGPCGDNTFLDTLETLHGAGIATVGGGRTLAEARQPAVLTAAGLRFAFLGYDDIAAYYNAGPGTAGTAPLDEATIVDDIRGAAAVADVVIIQPQWGVEYTSVPTTRQRTVARTAIEAGAALVAGNHPHVVQAAGPLAGGYVAFGLGNFVFDQDWSRETTEGVILEATFRRATLAATRLLPVRIENRLEPVFLTGDAAKAVLRRISAAAQGITD